jgi:hypothetical protein
MEQHWNAERRSRHRESLNCICPYCGVARFERTEYGTEPAYTVPTNDNERAVAAQVTAHLAKFLFEGHSRQKVVDALLNGQLGIEIRGGRGLSEHGR